MSSTDLKVLQNNLNTASALMASQVQYEDVAIFIGTTKSGKSSLINYLIGNQLIGERNHVSMPIIINTVGHSYGPEIGRNATSETVIPTKWENRQKLPGLALWDSPGFDDNRGSVQDITGAYYNYELFKNVKSIKIVLVTDINDIANSRINSFVKLLHSTESLLGSKMRECFPSIVVIFTKIPAVLNDNPIVNKDLIGNILDYQILSASSMNISETAKDFVRYLVQNNDNMGLFKKAEAGPINSNIEVGIFQAIKSAAIISEELLRNSVSPSIADGSKVFLYNHRQKLFSLKAFNEFQKVLNACFIDEINNFKDFIEKETSKDKLHSIKFQMNSQADQLRQILESDFSFEKKLSLLQFIHPKIESEVKKNKLLENSNLMNFVDRLLKNKESDQFDNNIQHILRNTVTMIEQMVAVIKYKLNEIDKNELEAQTKKLQDEHSTEMKKLADKLDGIKKHNENVKKELGPFGTIGNYFDEKIESVTNTVKDVYNTTVTWFSHLF